MAMQIALTLLLSVNFVVALRDSHTLAQQQGPFWCSKCCTEKCDFETHHVIGDLGPVQFQDCHVTKNQAFEFQGESVCEETCQISYFGKSKPVKVMRKSGSGPQKCTLRIPRKQGICEDACCAAKCSGQSEWKGQRQFQECTVRKEPEEVPGHGTFCVEDCTVLHSNKSQMSQKAKVIRRSGPRSPQCQLDHRDLDLPLQDLAKDFVDQLETALTKNYDLELMRPGKHGKVKTFLKKVRKEVLQPELKQQNYSREINATQTSVIIGDLHGQLFNLISFLILIQTRYNDKGFTTLD